MIVILVLISLPIRRICSFFGRARIKPSKPKDYKALIIMILVVTGSTRGIGKAIVDRFAHSASTIFAFLLRFQSAGGQAKI